MDARVDVTHLGALRRGLVDADGATLVGVVRDPSTRFERAVDESLPALGLPAALRDDLDALAADFRMAGLCDEGAHNAAWDDLRVDERYRAHLDGGDPGAALAALRERRRDGESLLLVGRENPGTKRSHAAVLREVLEADAETEGGGAMRDA